VALAATTFVGYAALRPSKANAWAWKDVCIGNYFNRSGAQSSVRPTFYVGVLPNPASISLYLAYLVAGIPTTNDFGLQLQNTGFPVPTFGCHATVTLSAPGPNVACGISAPTAGANTFSCSGDSTVRILSNGNNIVANVFIPKGSGRGGPEVRARRPSHGPAAIHTGNLPGGGWRATHKLSRVGLIGRLMKQGTPTASCQDGGNRNAQQISSRLLVRRGAPRGVGAVVGRFGAAHGAHQTVADALSHHSIHCLDRLLTSRRLHTSANSHRLVIPQRGGGVRGVQMVVRRRAHGTVRRAAFMDVIGASRGRRLAVLLLPSSHRPTGAQVQGAAVRTMLRRIGA
jgi:hypothetical protein